MKALFLSLFVLSSNVVFAETLTCSNESEGVSVSLQSGILTVNGQSYECLEAEGDVCTSINFETVESLVLTQSKENQTAVLEVMPSPGSGAIKTIDLNCR